MPGRYPVLVKGLIPMPHRMVSAMGPGRRRRSMASSFSLRGFDTGGLFLTADNTFRPNTVGYGLAADTEHFVSWPNCSVRPICER